MSLSADTTQEEYEKWHEKHQELWGPVHAAGASSLETALARLSEAVDSPIEERLLAALLGWFETCLPNLRITKAGVPVFLFETAQEYSTYNIDMQAPLGPYRADFLIEMHDPGLDVCVSVVVEADGHDFHERTKKQAAHDRKRDREIQQMGLKVFRFTGSEIFRDSASCAKFIHGAIADAVNGVLRARSPQ